ncbi:hypothetical protein ACSS6W_000219 [Trichoderma asperelloides]
MAINVEEYLILIAAPHISALTPYAILGNSEPISFDTRSAIWRRKPSAVVWSSLLEFKLGRPLAG